MQTFKDIIKTDRDCLCFANDIFPDVYSCENSLLSLLLLFCKHCHILDIEHNFRFFFQLLNSNFEVEIQNYLNRRSDPLVHSQYNIYQSFEQPIKQIAIRKTAMSLNQHLLSEVEENERTLFSELETRVFSDCYSSLSKGTIVPYKESYLIFVSDRCYYHRTQQIAQDLGFTTQVLNMDFPTNANHYNPFLYIRNTDDYIALSHHFMLDTTEIEQHKNYWSDPLYFILFETGLFMVNHIDISERNVKNWIKLTSRLIEIDDNHCKRKGAVLQEKLRLLLPTDRFVEHDRLFKNKDASTWDSIFESLGERLAHLPMEIIDKIMSDDDLELNRFGEANRILFIIRPANAVPPVNVWHPTKTDKVQKINWVYEIIRHQFLQMESDGNLDFDHHLEDHIDDTMSISDVESFKEYVVNLLNIDSDKVFV